MSSFRDSVSSIPGALTNLVSEGASVASSFVSSALGASTVASSAPPEEGSESSVTLNSSSGGHDKSWPIPASLMREQWRLIFTSDANARDLQEAIAHCRDLVLHSEECSEERTWLVRHLGDLRYALRELQDAEGGEPATASGSGGGSALMKTVVGHHFVPHRRIGSLSGTTQRCDHCTGIIWSVVQGSYICNACQFVCHQKCVDHVVRVCAHLTVSERQYPIEDICPEVGLAAQRYKCAECGTLLNFTLPASVACFGQKPNQEGHWAEPRLCDYNGYYYCSSCHWNDYAVIPARVVHNWDFVPRKVSRVSLQELNILYNKPLIKLEEANPKLFVFLEKLGTAKKLRQNLVYMRKYLTECRQANEEKLLENQIGTQRYLIQANELYSMHDLEQVESGVLNEHLGKILNIFDRHIRNCGMCTARAYICEICGNDEVIYPFDDGCIICDKCNSIYHRVCMTRKNMICPKCVRFQERRMKTDLRQSKRKERHMDRTKKASNTGSDNNEHRVDANNDHVNSDVDEDDVDEDVDEA